jgi:predicted  nucleic acid-binding Zn-ribbon protein
VKIEAAAWEIRALLELAELDRVARQPGERTSRRHREVAAGRLPRGVLDRYEFLLAMGRRPAVAVIDRGICSGCHIRLPTMVESKARLSVALHTCPHCQRMLYVPELAGVDAHGDDGRSRRPGPPAPPQAR